MNNALVFQTGDVWDRNKIFFVKMAKSEKKLCTTLELMLFTFDLHTHTHRNAIAHTHTHAHTRTHTRTHAHTRTHTHLQNAGDVAGPRAGVRQLDDSLPGGVGQRPPVHEHAAQLVHSRVTCEQSEKGDCECGSGVDCADVRRSFWIHWIVCPDRTRDDTALEFGHRQPFCNVMQSATDPVPGIHLSETPEPDPITGDQSEPPLSR